MKFPALLIFSISLSSVSAQQLRVTAADQPLQSPIEIHVPKTLDKNRNYQLHDQSGKAIIPAQWKDSMTLVFIPPTPIKAGRSETYRLKTVTGKVAKPIITVVENDEGLLVKIKSKPVFQYHIQEAMPPADSPVYYKRSGFIHPLYSPAGQVLTDDFPAGHVHQHAIFSAWVNTSFRGHPVDFWNQHLQTGTVMHSRVISVTAGPVFARIIAELKYLSFQDGEVLSEQWTMTIYPFADYFLFDLESVQKNVTSDTLFLKPYHYGGQAFRGSKEWNPDDKEHFKNRWKILTSEGIRDTAANGTHAKWVDASGMVGGQAAGTTVFNHPSNFRYPQALRVHPSMPYWCYAPEVDGGFFIPPGGRYQSKFRYFVHQQMPELSLITRLFDNWITGPRVTIH